MLFPLLFLFVVMGMPAHAHPGHVAEAAGHTHWVASAALALMVLAVLWIAVSARTQSKTEAGDPPKSKEETA